MKVFWKDPHKLLQIEAECANDLELLCDLLHGQAESGFNAPLRGATWVKCPTDELPFACGDNDGITTVVGVKSKVIGCVWDVQQHAQQGLAAQSACETFSALQKMVRLGLGEHTNDLVARLGRIESQLQPQEQLAPVLKHLQSMLGVLVVEVGQQKAVINALMRTHGDSPVDETPIVKE